MNILVSNFASLLETGFDCRLQKKIRYEHTFLV